MPLTFTQVVTKFDAVKLKITASRERDGETVRVFNKDGTAFMVREGDQDVPLKGVGPDRDTAADAAFTKFGIAFPAAKPPASPMEKIGDEIASLNARVKELEGGDAGDVTSRIIALEQAVGVIGAKLTATMQKLAELSGGKTKGKGDKSAPDQTTEP